MVFVIEVVIELFLVCKECEGVGSGLDSKRFLLVGEIKCFVLRILS